MQTYEILSEMKELNINVELYHNKISMNLSCLVCLILQGFDIS